MRFGPWRLLLAAALISGVAGTGRATTVWDEAVNGDLSNNGLSPTALSLAGGSNVVSGTTGNPGDGVDRDYFSFALPVGGTLTAISVLPGTQTQGLSFFGIQAGPVMTVGPNGENSQDLLAWTHYTDTPGQNLLALMNLAGGLPAGTYTVWVQELGQRVDYNFDFVVNAPVPLPGAALLLVSGLGGLAALRRRRANAAVPVVV